MKLVHGVLCVALSACGGPAKLSSASSAEDRYSSLAFDPLDSDPLKQARQVAADAVDIQYPLTKPRTIYQIEFVSLSGDCMNVGSTKRGANYEEPAYQWTWTLYDRASASFIDVVGFGENFAVFGVRDRDQADAPATFLPSSDFGPTAIANRVMEDYKSDSMAGDKVIRSFWLHVASDWFGNQYVAWELKLVDGTAVTYLVE